MTVMKNVLVISEDETLRDEIAGKLGAGDGFKTDGRTCFQMGLQAANNGNYDMVVIDIDRATAQDYQILQCIRAAGSILPLIALSSRTDELAEITCLKYGADAYVTKPLHFELFIARIMAQLRNHTSREDQVIQIGLLEFRPAEKTIMAGQGHPTRLTRKERDILEALVNAKQETVLRRDLLENIWGYNDRVKTHTLETHIYRLRKKLAVHIPGKSPIVTELAGYSFIG